MQRLLGLAHVETHAGSHLGCLGELNLRIVDHIVAVARGARKPGEAPPTGRRSKTVRARAFLGGLGALRLRPVPDHPRLACRETEASGSGNDLDAVSIDCVPCIFRIGGPVIGKRGNRDRGRVGLPYPRGA